jgi:hypothetical protein
MHRSSATRPPPLGRVVRWFFAEGPGAVVALVAGIVAVLFTLFPDLKPFSATELSAKMEIVTTERAVTRDQWRWRVAVGDPERHAGMVQADKQAAGAPAGQPCKVLGAAPGFTIYVSSDVEGFKRRELTMRAALYDARTGRRVPDVEEFRALARVPIDAPTASSVQEIWLYDPGDVPKYFARVQLYDPKEHLLDIADSKPFRRISGLELETLPTDCAQMP